MLESYLRFFNEVQHGFWKSRNEKNTLEMAFLIISHLMVTKLSYFMILRFGTIVGSLWYLCSESLCHILK